MKCLILLTYFLTKEHFFIIFFNIIFLFYKKFMPMGTTVAQANSECTLITTVTIRKYFLTMNSMKIQYWNEE